MEFTRVDETYFENINTHEKAYVLGFFAADGYLKMYKNSIRFRIHPKDISILNFIKSEMDTDYKITYTKQGYAEFGITRKTLHDQLVRLGFNNNKSRDCIFPDIPEEFYNSFILGLFDGDGSVWVRSKTRRGLGVNLLGTVPVIDKIIDLISKEGVDCHYDFLPNNYTKRLYFGSEKSVKNFYNYIYRNCKFSSKRKKEIFNNYFNN
jgi:hypothetical protein